MSDCGWGDVDLVVVLLKLIEMLLAFLCVLVGLVVVRVVIIAGHEGPSGRTSQADHIGHVHPDVSEIPFKKTYRDFV